MKANQAGNYLSWPGLTAKKVNKHYPEMDETPKGNMRQVRQSVRSTKKKPTVVEEKYDSNKHVTLRKHHNIYVQIDQLRDIIYTNQTVKFPIMSSRMHKYIMILCAINGNVVLAEPMKNNLEGAMVETYQNLIKRLNDAGILPKNHILDNEISKEYKEAIESNGMTWEVVPVGMHRRNVAVHPYRYQFPSHSIRLNCLLVFFGDFIIQNMIFW